jgi:hypothetical protein
MFFQNGIISQKIMLFITTIARISNPTQCDSYLLVSFHSIENLHHFQKKKIQPPYLKLNLYNFLDDV